MQIFACYVIKVTESIEIKLDVTAEMNLYFQTTPLFSMISCSMTHKPRPLTKLELCRKFGPLKWGHCPDKAENPFIKD